MRRLGVHGVSEILAVVLLSAIVAALGFFIVYNVVQMSSLITQAVTSKKCSFTIVSVPYSKNQTTVSLMPVVYNSGEAPCRITLVYVIEEDRVVKRARVNVIVHPRQIKVIGPIEVNTSDIGSGDLLVRVVASDGTVQDYIVRIG